MIVVLDRVRDHVGGVAADDLEGVVVIEEDDGLAAGATAAAHPGEIEAGGRGKRAGQRQIEVRQRRQPREAGFAIGQVFDAHPLEG